MSEYIEREVVKQQIVDEQTETHVSCGNAGYEIGYHKGPSIAMVVSVPAADVAPVRHGRWENIRFLTTGDGRVRVGDWSSCKSIERVRNYCPNCGARMDGE